MGFRKTGMKSYGSEFGHWSERPKAALSCDVIDRSTTRVPIQVWIEPSFKDGNAATDLDRCRSFGCIRRPLCLITARWLYGTVCVFTVSFSHKRRAADWFLGTIELLTDRMSSSLLFLLSWLTWKHWNILLLRWSNYVSFLKTILPIS